MIGTIKSEFRKLLSVRSTGMNVIVCLLIIGLFAGYGNGFHIDVRKLHDSHLLMDQSLHAIIFVGLILAFVGLLLAGNEYRYNTIMYTLTASNRRTKVLLSKVLVVSVFAVLASILIAFFSPLCAIVGTHLAGKHLVPQTFDTWSVLWHCMFVGWAYAMYALILVLVMRNQIGAIVTFLLMPLIGENILTGLFKHIGQYLPFTAAQSVALPTSLGNHTTSGHEVIVVLIYVAIGLVASWLVFTQRDAN